MEQVVAIVLNYKRAADTLACVASLERQIPKPSVIVVDNGGHDVEALREQLPADAVLLPTDLNLGYAGGNNVGLKRALGDGADLVLVLNNDVVVQPGCIDNLVDALRRHPEWGVVGPLSLLAEDPTKVDFISARVNLPYVALNADGRDGAVEEVGFHDRETDYVTGSAMLFRRAALEAAGLFDERFFLVWEDVDLCLRLRMAGWLCGATPSATVVHTRGATFGADGSVLQRYFFARNSFLIVRKHLSPATKRWRAEARAARRYVKWGHGTTPMHAAIRRGWQDGLLGRFGAPPRDLAI